MALPPRIALIGFMGSGKSSVGRLLASNLGYRFRDLDGLIEERAGRSIAEIFQSEGEGRFRELETEALYSLEGEEKLVLATGGGAPIQPQNRPFFTSACFTVYLEVSFEEFKRRTAGDPARPLLQKPEQELHRLYASRLPVYRSLGRRLPTDCLKPEKIAAEILALLRQDASI